MSPVGVNQRIGDESPDVRAAAGQGAPKHYGVVIARGDESKRQQKFDVLLLGQQKCANEMHQCQHCEQSENDWRYIEDWFAIHSRGPGETLSFAVSPPSRKPDRSIQIKKGGLTPSLEPRCGV